MSAVTRMKATSTTSTPEPELVPAPTESQEKKKMKKRKIFHNREEKDKEREDISKSLFTKLWHIFEFLNTLILIIRSKSTSIRKIKRYSIDIDKSFNVFREDT